MGKIIATNIYQLEALRKWGAFFFLILLTYKINQNQIKMPKQIKLVDEDQEVKFTDNDSLFFEHKGGVVCLHDDVLGELGWFKVWYDADMDDREYITLNHSITYLDTLSEL